MNLSKEVSEFVSAYSGVTNAAALADYRRARAGLARSKDNDLEVVEGVRRRGEASAGQLPQEIPTAPTSGGGTFGVPDNLWQAQTHQESGGKQFGVDGVPLTSSKGAVGVAQVMPATAPEAAQLAGVPYDENRYRTDPQYNAALGRAYMGKQLQDFGDQGQALAAYNAGPQRVRDAVSRYGGAWLTHMPAETQNYIARITGRLQPRVAAYALGGLVSGEDDNDLTEPDADTDDTPSAIPVSAPQAVAQPQPQQPAFDPMQLVSKVGGALYDGMQYLQSFFGLSEATAGAIPGGQSAADGIRRFLSNEGEASPEDYEAVVRTVDPNRQLNDGLRNAAGLAAVHDYWLAKGDPEKAAKTAGSLLKYMRTLSARYGSEAVANLRAGRFEDAKVALNKSIDQMPDGKSLDIAMSPDGSAAVIQKDAQGKPIAQKRLSPEQLLGIATGLSDSTLYWKTLVESAGKYDPESQAGSEAYQQALGGLSPQPTAQPAQEAIPTAVTQGGNTPAQAIPATSSPPEVPMATPEQMAAMSPRERTSYLATRNQLAHDRQKVVDENNREHRADLRTQRQIDAEDRREARKQQAIPTPESRRQTADAIQGAVDQFEATLPEGTTLAAADKRAIGTAASHLFGANNVSPSESVDAVLDLTDPNNAALDKATGGSVALRNGTSVNLDPQTLGALKTLRAKKLKDVETSKIAEEGSWKKRAGRAVSTIAENAALPQAAKAYGELVPGMMEWAQQAWDAYQKSKPSRTVSLDSK